MEEQPIAAAIRASWIQWLTNASDEQVLRFHEQIFDMLAEDEMDVQDALDKIDGVMRRGFTDPDITPSA